MVVDGPQPCSGEADNKTWTQRSTGVGASCNSASQTLVDFLSARYSALPGSLAILARGEAGQRLELAAEGTVVGVAAVQGDIGNRHIAV